MKLLATILLILFFLSSLLLLQFQTCYAQEQEQEVAFYDSEAFFVEWGEWQEAPKKLTAYQVGLYVSLKFKQNVFQEEIQDFLERMRHICIDESATQKYRKKFKKKEQGIMEQEKAIDSLVIAHQTELETPLKEKMNRALKNIAKKKYAYLIDQSKIAAHIKEGKDISYLLKEALITL